MASIASGVREPELLMRRHAVLFLIGVKYMPLDGNLGSHFDSEVDNNGEPGQTRRRFLGGAARTMAMTVAAAPFAMIGSARAKSGKASELDSLAKASGGLNSAP